MTALGAGSGPGLPGSVGLPSLAVEMKHADRHDVLIKPSGYTLLAKDTYRL
jgi:hypothetical protein